MSQPLLVLDHVSKTFHRSGGERIQAVRDASLSVAAGETVALVGESGSGKSTLGRIALGLLAPDTGRVSLDGRCLGQLAPSEMRRVRVSMQPVFQDASASLNPRRTASELLRQAFRRDPADAATRSVDLLDRVGLRPGSAYLARYPHELSGGQRQRLAIARALAAEPRIIIADEPLSGADVSIRGQLLNLFLDIRERQTMAYLMITHDISVARAFADRVAVMQHGEIVEVGRAESVLGAPRHPYTRQLVAAVPSIDMR
jgi:ABC-type glutathione transport system ATPase component